jgi:orotidine-5'-phosphate decarboxylase
MQVLPIAPWSTQPKDRLAFALDVDDLDQARHWIERLREHVGVFKVGLELFVRFGPAAVAVVREQGARCFLDLKLHDIPETVGRAVRAAADTGAELLTVHASGGRSMLERAAIEARGRTQLLAVTALTSLDDRALADLGYHGNAEDVVRRWASIAMASAVPGVVCSPHEAKVLRAMLPDLFIVTPGIRFASESAGDQARVASARDAVLAGADLLVVGRPIRDAREPEVAAAAIVKEIESALAMR